MSLSSLPTALLIPPLNLIPLALAGLVARRRFGIALTAIALAGLFACSLPIVSLSLLAALEAGLPRDTLSQPGYPQAIVILSGDAGYGDDGGLTLGSGIGAMTLDRMRAGAIAQRQTHLPVLVTGGPLEPNAQPIATQMAASLREDFAVPVKWTEDASTDTWENAEYSALQLKAENIQTVYLVTHAWHMRRAVLAFAHFGIVALPAPVRFDRSPAARVEDMTPHMSALVASYYAFHEAIGCLYYWLRE